MSTLHPLYPGRSGSQGAVAAGPPLMPEHDSGLSLSAFVDILKRRRNLIVGIVLLVTSLVAIYVNQLTPLYSAEATLVVEPSRQHVLNVQSVVSGLRPDYYTNETQAAVIGSRELARKAVLKLDLVKNPLFNPDLAPPKRGVIRSLRKWIGAVAGEIRLWVMDLATGGRYGVQRARTRARVRADRAKSPSEQREEAIEYATDLYLYGLNIIPSQRSRVITVQVSSEDPNVAVQAANTTADIYILDQLESKGQATTRASEWLNRRAGELRNRVISSEKRLEDFRRKSGIVEVGGSSVYARQRAELDSQLVVARTKRAEAEARYEQVQKMLGDGAELDTVAAVLDSQLIQRLREQEAQVVRKIAELKTQFREGHPKLVLARNELKDLQAKTASEVRKIVTNLKNEAEIAAVREKNLQGEISRIQAKLDQQQGAEVTLRALESEVKANKQLYETILARLKETGVQEEGIQEPDARIISRATLPTSPYYPRKKFMIGATIVISTIMAIGLAILLEFLDRGFRSVRQIEAFTGLPNLAILPIVRNARRRKAQLAFLAPERSGAVFAEAIRTLRTGLLLSRVDQPPKTIMVTSAGPGEGKTSTALALAAMVAQSGQRACVVDCDMRNPNVHKGLGCENDKGLADYLSGAAELSEIIEFETRHGLRYITAGLHAPNPADLLGSQRMRELLDQLTRLFDMVVLDTPPLLVVSDSLVIARYVDKTTFVVRWAKTSRHAVIDALKILLEAGASVAGTILAQVDVRRHAQYDVRDAGYSRYHNYYVTGE